ncbi:MAG: ribonuclease HI [Calditrichaeota bacterium]|nr:ribonuclease HI [Calditrichota bacterium]
MILLNDGPNHPSGRPPTVVTIYTDGACSGNPGPGGWAAILLSGVHRKEITGYEASTTNNRMELTAAIRALEALKRSSVVEVYSDSSYLVRGMTEWLPGWIRKQWRLSTGGAVENRDLWERLQTLAAKHRIEWHWVRGHAADPLNREVDRLARTAIPK